MKNKLTSPLSKASTNMANPSNPEVQNQHVSACRHALSTHRTKVEMAPSKAELAGKITATWGVNSVLEALPECWNKDVSKERGDDEWGLEPLAALAELSDILPDSLDDVRDRLGKKFIRRSSTRNKLAIGDTWEKKQANILADTKEIIDAVKAGEHDEQDEQVPDQVLLHDEEDESAHSKRQRLLDEISACWVVEDENFDITNILPHAIRKHMENEEDPLQWSTLFLEILREIAGYGKNHPELKLHDTTSMIHHRWDERTGKFRKGQSKDLHQNDLIAVLNSLRATYSESEDSSDDGGMQITGASKRSPAPDDDDDGDGGSATGSVKRRKIASDLDRADGAMLDHDDNDALEAQDAAEPDKVDPQPHRTRAPDEEVKTHPEMKTAIERYWNLEGRCSEVVPVAMRPSGEPESWGSSPGRVLTELYKLARITYGRHSEAMVIMRRHFDQRTAKTKTLGVSDVKDAISFFDKDGPPAAAGPSEVASVPTRALPRQTRANARPASVAGPSVPARANNLQARPANQQQQQQPAPAAPTTLATLMSHPTSTTILAITSTSPLGTQLSALSAQIQAADNEVRIAECELAILRNRRARMNSYMLNGHPLEVQEEIAEKEAEVERKKREVLRLRGEVVERIRGREG